jgi:polysaccharide biosynthesis protein VpsM
MASMAKPVYASVKPESESVVAAVDPEKACEIFHTNAQQCDNLSQVARRCEEDSWYKTRAAVPVGGVSPPCNNLFNLTATVKNMLTSSLRPLVALSLMSVACSAALAQSEPRAVGIKQDPLTLYPTASLSIGQNDNVLLTPARVSSGVQIFGAGLKAEAQSGKSKYSVGYDGTFGRYNKSSADNYNYHVFSAIADMDLDSRARLKLGADYMEKSDPRGSLPTANTAVPNEYKQSGVNGLFSYGAQGAQGRIELEGAYTDKSYQNNRVVTTNLDVRTAKGGATFFWRIAPKTEWLFQGVVTESDYKSSTALTDNTEYKFLTGLKWEATALTEGTFKIGYVKKDFWLPAATDAKGFVWDGSVSWKPLTYSTFDFNTGKSFNDPLGGGNIINNRNANVKWTHSWTDRIKSEASAGLIKDDYSGLGRNDTTSSYGMKLTHDTLRWLTLGAEYTYTNRASNQSNFEYRKNLILFSAKVAL